MPQLPTKRSLSSCDVVIEEADARSTLQTLWDKLVLTWQRLRPSCSCREDPDQELMALSAPRGSFEEQQAASAVKFEVGYIIVEMLILGIGVITEQGRSWPLEGVHLWPGGVFSIGHRLVVSTLRPHLRKCFPSRVIWALPAICFLLDGLLIASCHPHVVGRVWAKQEAPIEPEWSGFHFEAEQVTGLNVTAAQDFIDFTESEVSYWTNLFKVWEAAKFEYDGMLTEEYVLTHYVLNIAIWYHCIFILSFRKAIIFVPVVVCLYIAVAACSLEEPGEKSDAPKEGLELSLVLFNSAVAVASKAKLEKAQRMEFKFSEEKRQEAIKERVLRYEAEFAKERLSGGSPWNAKAVEREPSVAPSQPSVCSTAVSRAGASVRSAPAALHTGPVMSQMRRSGECLPPDSVVWVEGHPMPRPVCTVRSGEKVLCHDTLSLVPKFVEVRDSTLITGHAPWVVVTLADGTALTMTADHPTQPRRETGALPLAGHVAASCLKPGSDSLMVLKMQPVEVESVIPTAGCGKRVALSIHQPDRHEVFAAPPSSVPGQDVATMAIGSADMAAPAPGSAAAAGRGERAFGLTVKRTFIDVDDDGDASSLPMTRSSSCPARVRDPPAKSKAVTWAPSASKPHAVDSVHPPQPRLRRVGSESDVTSQSSRQSSTPTDIDVLVAVTSGVGAATVSEMLHVKKGGFPSKGSVGHECGTCQPCFFENRHQHGDGPPCFKGALCERCHCRHDLIGRKKRVPGPTRGGRKIQARLGANEFENAAAVGGADLPRCVMVPSTAVQL
mmetsp:Transcript_33890/g.79248  ORF Transcript_33890/g.79248 Transcript_33890/m.79248 type:complete len:782 (+) Transcript_33890:101-2446(+)